MNGEQKNQFLLLAMHALMKNAQDFIFIKDRNLRYVSASDSFGHMVGLQSGEEIVGKTDFEVFEKELAMKYTRDDHYLLKMAKGNVSYIEPLPIENGRNKYSSTSKFIIADENGQAIGIYGVGRDITVQMELEAERERSRLSRELFDSTLDADITEDCVLRKDGNAWVMAEEREWDTFSGFIHAFAENKVKEDYRERLLSHYDLEQLECSFLDGTKELGYLFPLGDGEEYRWVECTTRIYHSKVSDTLRITLFLKDVDDDIRNRHMLIKKANTDALTGLRNRESALNQIKNILEIRKEETCALLFIDLDGFKQVNDSMGHQFGDCVLQEFAKRLRRIFREEDILGRMGGDEFIVFLKWIPSKEVVVQRATQILDEANLHFTVDGKTCRVTCSVGISLCKKETTTWDALYEEADKAMYHAKELGKNRIFFFEDMQ